VRIAVRIAKERLRAFFETLAEHLARHHELIAEAERSQTAVAQFNGGVYAAWHAHVRVLLRELDPDLDDDMTAYLLLACLRPGPSRRFATQRNVGGCLKRSTFSCATSPTSLP
jgi:hypothetical protein